MRGVNIVSESRSVTLCSHLATKVGDTNLYRRPRQSKHARRLVGVLGEWMTFVTLAVIGRRSSLPIQFVEMSATTRSSSNADKNARRV